MKTIRVQYEEPARSKSRNVNAYTRAFVRRNACDRAKAAENAAISLAAAKLTGGQLAEARRRLIEAGVFVPGGAA